MIGVLETYNHRKRFVAVDRSREYEINAMKWATRQMKESSMFLRTGKPSCYKYEEYKFSKEDVDEMVRLYTQEKMSVRGIAEKYGIGHPTISRILKDRGVTVYKINKHVV
jgi:DNA invertase Pin-like site-specific DNA recombinase